MITLEWKDLAWILGVLGMAGGSLIAFVRFRLSGEFAKASDVSALAAKVSALDQRLGQMPSHEDVRAVQARVGSVEQAVAVVGANVAGLEKIMVRVEHQVNLMSEHLIREGR